MFKHRYEWDPKAMLSKVEELRQREKSMEILSQEEMLRTMDALTNETSRQREKAQRLFVD